MAKNAISKNTAVDSAKAREIFTRKLAEMADGRRANSQRKRDGDIIVELLSGGGGARLSVFSATFEELYGIDSKRAGGRVRAAMADLVAAKKVSVTEERRPVYSLAG